MVFNNKLEPILNSPNEILTQIRIGKRKRMDKLTFWGGDKILNKHKWNF